MKKDLDTNKPSLAGVLTRTLFIGLFFVFIILSLFLNIYGSIILRNITNERINYILNSQADNLAQLLWDFETEKINTTLKNIVNDNNIRSSKIVEIKDEKESVIAQYEWDDTYEQKVLFRDIIYKNEQEEPRKVGILKISVDYESIERRIRGVLIFTGTLLGSVFLLLGLTIFFVLKKSISPVTELSDSLVNADYFTHKIVKPTGGTREINDLFDSLIKMQSIMQEQTVEIHEQKIMLDTIIDKMPLGVSVESTDVSDEFLIVNDKYKKLFNFDAQVISPHDIFKMHKAQDAEQLRALSKQVLINNRVEEIPEYHAATTEGHFVAHIIKAPVFDEYGKVSLLITMIDDVTDQNFSRINLIEAKNIAEKANHAKGEFLANMSHELRTPMNSIIGLTTMVIEDGTNSPEHQDMLKTVLKSSNILLNIVNDILDLSKIEAGGIKLETIPFDLQDTLHVVFETLRPLASSKSLSLKVTQYGNAVKIVNGDSTRLARIITNLGSNAIKFTPQGEIEMEIDYTPIDSEKIEFVCKVKDSGIGIPPDKLDYIFEKFSQADDSITRKFGGTGLGLAITKQLVELMGGSITVQSEVGVGSVFTVRIPFSIALEKNTEEDARKLALRNSRDPSRKSLSDIRILIAEDQKMNQLVISKMLERMGVKDFKIADDGAIALNMFTSDPTYDLVILDCHMPNMTGYEAASAIRKFESEKKLSGVPILAMTADAMVGTREKCLEAGMTDYISKPVNAKIFAELLSQWFSEGEKKAS